MLLAEIMRTDKPLLQNYSIADSGRNKFIFPTRRLREFVARRRVRRKKAPGIRKKIPGVVF